MADSDAELLRRSKAGDNTAFDALVASHQERVFALAYRILGNAEDAADVQQETFVRAWTRLRDFRGQAAFSTWLHRITVNICLSRKRGRPRPESLDEDDRVQWPEGACADQNRLIDGMIVREMLDGMSVRDRALLILREVEEMTIEEIAQVTGSSVHAVTKQLWRVRKAFRERLREHLEDGQ